MLLSQNLWPHEREVFICDSLTFSWLLNPATSWRRSTSWKSRPDWWYVSLWDVTESICWDIKIQQTSERTYICRLDSFKVILSHSNFVYSCPGSFYVTLSHIILSQVILSHLESLKLLMLEVRQFNIRYTVTQWWLPPQCATSVRKFWLVEYVT